MQDPAPQGTEQPIRATTRSAPQIAWILRGLIVVQVTACVVLGAFLTHHIARIVTVPGCYMLAVVAVLWVHVTVTGAQFMLARRGQARLPFGLRLTGYEAARTYDREIDASMRGIWWSNPFRFGTPIPAPIAPCRSLPILCVHGYFCTRAVWLPFARAAVARGYHCAAITLEPPFCVIDDNQAAIGRALDDLLQSTGASEAVIVAHSMGALAARAYLRGTAEARVARLVTLGAPHHGTTLAVFSRSRNGKEMRRDSAWLKRLNEAETAASLERITSIYSVHDNIVAPYQTAVLEGAENCMLSGLGHVSLLYAKEVWTEIFSAIERDRSAVPETA